MKHENNSFYFSHDIDAVSDPRLSQLISAYGMEGYGMYWRLVEMMHQQESTELPLRGKYIAQTYATKLHTTPERAMQFIQDCIHEFQDGDPAKGLFEERNGNFFSRSAKRRKQMRMHLRRIRSKIGRKGGLASAKSRKKP